MFLIQVLAATCNKDVSFIQLSSFFELFTLSRFISLYSCQHVAVAVE